MPDYQKAADKAANRYGLDPKIFRAMIRQESGFQPGAKSSAGARGIAQFMPATAEQYGVNLNDNRVSDDLDGAARYLAEGLKKYGSYQRALSVYNSGRPDAYKDPNFAGGQTHDYVKTILGGAKTETPSTRSSGPTPSTSSSTVTTTTTPGVDNSGMRRQLVSDFLAQGGVKSSTASAAFASGIRNAQDVPGTISTRTTKAQVDPETATVSGVKAITDRADKLNAEKRPYVYGGGHGNDSWGIDCSAAVSQALGVDVRVSGEFEKFGKPGPGKNVTILANDKHVLMRVRDPETGSWHYWGTSTSNPEGGPGWIPASALPASYLKNFTARHPAGQ